jgi:hypothetical protein
VFAIRELLTARTTDRVDGALADRVEGFRLLATGTDPVRLGHEPAVSRS